MCVWMRRIVIEWRAAISLTVSFSSCQMPNDDVEPPTFFKVKRLEEEMLGQVMYDTYCLPSSAGSFTGIESHPTASTRE